MKANSLRAAALYLWERELGQPYLWAGDDPILGFDCSGLVVEVLKAVGVLPRIGDWTAEALAVHFQSRETTRLRPGCLLFYNRHHKIGHVEVVWKVIGDRVLTIGAAGGGRKTKTREDAAEQNAYVKVRPAKIGWVRAVDPFIGG
jgi:hypothetical protein